MTKCAIADAAGQAGQQASIVSWLWENLTWLAMIVT